MDDRSKTVQNPNDEPESSPSSLIDFSAGANVPPIRNEISGLSVQLAMWTIIGAIFLALAAAAMVILFITRQLSPTGARAVWISSGVLALLAGLFVLAPYAARWYQREMSARGIKLSGDPTRRVRCVCNATFRDRLGTIPSDPFEPVLVRVLLAAKPGKAFIWTWVLGGLAAMLATILFLRFGFGGWRVASAPIMSFGYVYFAVGASGGAFIAAFLFPSYIRIAPGRADLLRFGFLGRGTPTLETFDLRSSEVVIVTNTYVALVRSAPNDQWRTLMYAGSLSRTRVVRALLAAAVSEHPTPPMPDDALLG